MELKIVNFINFRNLEDYSLSVSDGITLFHGKNGQGKTSILEAVYFAATGKSFRTSKIQELIKYNKDKCGVFLSYKDKIDEKTIAIKFSEKKKEYSYNSKKTTYDDYYGKLNVVSFIPEDIELITGPPGVRRRFFDEEISQGDEEYFKNIKDYSKILKIRNHHLKSGIYKGEIFEVYEEEFIKLAAKIIKKRMDYIKNIGIILNLNYRKIFDNKKELGVRYISEIDYDKKDTISSIEEKIKANLKEKSFQEKRYGYTLVGPQKDEFRFYLNDKDAKSYSSQGEKKSIVFALKLSEIDMIFKEKKEKPIFIIDDISSYFDENRKQSILTFLKNRGVQLLISSTTEIGIPCKTFRIENGVVYDTD